MVISYHLQSSDCQVRTCYKIQHVVSQCSMNIMLHQVHFVLHIITSQYKFSIPNCPKIVIDYSSDSSPLNGVS